MLSRSPASRATSLPGVVCRRRARALRASGVRVRRAGLEREGAAHRLARLLGELLADHAFDLTPVIAGEPVRAAAGQQLVEHHAQRVDVARRSQWLPPNLLRAGVARGEQAIGRGQLEVASSLGVEQLRDPEVDQLGDALRRHQDVAGA